MQNVRRISAASSAVLIIVAAVWAQAPTGQGQGKGQGKGKGGAGYAAARQALLAMPRPIDMPDTVWIEDMTLLEVRDLLKAGKTTAMIFAGGMEDNGPYVTVSQHNLIIHAMCDSIARKLGNAMCAPIVGLSPGSPERSASPGSVSITADTFKSILTDEASSLKAQGFKNVLFMVDHGSDARPAEETSKALGEKWAGSGTASYYIPEYYDNHGLEQFVTDVLNVHEDISGKSGPHFHDDYFTAAVSVAIDPEEARMPERIKAHKTLVNGVDLALPKAVSDGKRIMAFREEQTVKAIQKLIPPHS